MPIFQYVAFHGGKKHKGKIEARNNREALQHLKEKGLQAIWLSQNKQKRQSFLFEEIQLFSPKVKNQDFVVFCRQFATLIQAGIGAAESLQILSRQTENKLLRKALEEVYVEIRSGRNLSSAFQTNPSVFPSIFVNMIRAGEISGNLDDVLERLATFFEKEHITREKIRSAMTYPVTVSILAAMVTFFMMWKIVPQFVSTFTSLGIELPLLTRMVMAACDGFMRFWYLVILLPILLLLLCRFWLRTPKGRYYADYLKLKLPIFGKLAQKTAMARFCRTFSSLFGAAVPILQILNIVSQVVGNEVISKALEEAKENLRRGQSLAVPLKESWVFPPMVAHMVAVGEQSGTLDSSLEKVADFYEEDVNQMTERLKSMLEPLLIMIVAAIVGLVVLSVLLPSFTIYRNLR